MNWYYVENGQRLGPVGEAEFEEFVRQGRISADTLVWQQGMADWKSLREVRPQAAVDAPPVIPVPPVETAAPHAETVSQPAVGGQACTACGRNFSPDALIRYRDSLVCADCKPAFVQRLREGVGVPGGFHYGGFWIRFLAKFIDGTIQGIIGFFLGLAATLIMGDYDSNTTMVIQVNNSLLGVVIGAAYTTWFLGRFAATPGKMALGLKVIRSDGTQVTYLRALGRHFAEMLSGIILLIGYIMAAFDIEKRTLHDRICDTRVVRK